MRNNALIDWRSHTPNAETLPAIVGKFLDTATELALCDERAFWYFRYDACDMFGLVHMLEFLKHTGVLTMLSEKHQLDQAIEWLQERETPYMTAQEVRMRLAASEGNCPLCGSDVSFESEPRTDTHRRSFGSAKAGETYRYYQVIGRCGHFFYDRVHNVEEIVRSPRAWQGYRWPSSFGEQIANADGQPLRGENDYISPHCSTCRGMGARRQIQPKLEALFTELMANADNPSWHGLGSSPLSAFICREEHKPGEVCQHERVRIKRLVATVVNDEHSEHRLNGAGLKLYARGVRADFRKDVTFSMYVGGDQHDHYAEFVEQVNHRLHTMGLQQYQYPPKE